MEINKKRRGWFIFNFEVILLILAFGIANINSKNPKKAEETTTAETTEIANMLPFTNFFTTTARPNQDPTTFAKRIPQEEFVRTSIAHAIPRTGFFTTDGISNTEFPTEAVYREESKMADAPVMKQDIPPTIFFTTDAIVNTKFPNTDMDVTATRKLEPETEPKQTPEIAGAIARTAFFATTEPGEFTSIANAIPFSNFFTTTSVPNARTGTTGVPNQTSTTKDTATLNNIYVNEINTPLDLGIIAAPIPMMTPSLMIANIEDPNNAALELELPSSDGSLPDNSSSLLTQKKLQLKDLGSLLDSVLNNYDQRIRPREDQTRPVTIFSDFVPQSIIEFDTQLQSFSVMGYFKMDWRDDFLKWDPSEYDQTETLRIPAKSVWIPKLVVNKGQDGHGLVGDRDTDIVLINHKGYVRWFPEGIYSVVCEVTIKFYPFDAQNCTFSYFIADEDNSTINLRDYGDVDLSEYIENAEWKLVNLSVDRHQIGLINFINFHFKVERRGGFAMFTLIVPVLMLSLLGGATFLIPIESGEKCSFSVTIFLAYGIFETIVIDTLPHNSLDVSYFIIYLTSMLIVSTLLTFYTILQAKIFDLLGNREFRLFSCRRNSYGITWGKLLQKLDTYVFCAFLVVVVGCTSTVLAVLSAQFDFL